MWRSGCTYEESSDGEQDPGTDEPGRFEAVRGIEGVGAKGEGAPRVEGDHCSRSGGCVDGRWSRTWLRAAVLRGSEVICGTCAVGVELFADWCEMMSVCVLCVSLGGDCAELAEAEVVDVSVG